LEKKVNHRDKTNAEKIYNRCMEVRKIAEMLAESDMMDGSCGVVHKMVEKDFGDDEIVAFICSALRNAKGEKQSRHAVLLARTHLPAGLKGEKLKRVLKAELKLHVANDSNKGFNDVIKRMNRAAAKGLITPIDAD
jgi:hypothetical protein